MGAACLCILVGNVAVATPVAKEYEVKAAFLYNFTKYVEWPKESFAGPDDPIVIGILGGNPFGEELENIVKGRTVNGRPVVVVNVRTVAELKRVSVLFVPAGQEVLLNGALKNFDDATVLTVGETERFAALGGAIVFKNVDDKVRFSINIAAAERARLKISSQLQKLALVVRRQP